MLKRSITILTITLLVCCGGLAFAQPNAQPNKALQAAIPKPAENTKIQCEVVVTKPAAWDNYDVTIEMLNYADKKVAETFNLTAAKGSEKSVNSVTKTFGCYQYQYVQFNAQYLPLIWSTNKGKVYPSKLIYRVAGQLLQADKLTEKLVINLHFPDDFVSVPALVNGSH